MCGIMGYTGAKAAGPILIEGLRALEYRGYDSAGIALLGSMQGDALYVARAVGKLGALERCVEGRLPSSVAGIGHTRWATHGEPSERNAHPHVDPGSRVAVVHNGIVENFEVLRARYGADAFASDTDTEVLAHMIASRVSAGCDLLEAVREVVCAAVGAYSLAAVSRDDPGRIVAARVGNAGGIVIGVGEGEHLIASDLAALMPYTRDVVFLEPGELVDLRAGSARYLDESGCTVTKTIEVLAPDVIAAGKGGFESYMLKEIYEQPEAIERASAGRYLAGPGLVRLEDFPLDEAQARSIDRVLLVGMGTSMHSAMIGRNYFEHFAGLPAEADNASEFCFRAARLNPRTLVVSVTQSGETVDTLRAMAVARAAGCMQITVCNTPGAQTTRVADGTVLLRVGSEVSVASTKTFVASVLMLHALALQIGRLRGCLDPAVERAQVQAALALPDAMRRTLEDGDHVREIADRFFTYEHFLFLGRGLGYPTALEGALKLKEVAYVHAEGYAAGEMKHGPIALIDRRVATLALAPADAAHDKMRSSIEQIRARRGAVIAVVTAGDRGLDGVVNDLIEVPAVDPMLVPIVAAIPMQLLAHHMATRRGTDIDQPRNLAKTVTVE